MPGGPQLERHPGAMAAEAVALGQTGKDVKPLSAEEMKELLDRLVAQHAILNAIEDDARLV